MGDSLSPLQQYGAAPCRGAPPAEYTEVTLRPISTLGYCSALRLFLPPPLPPSSSFRSSCSGLPFPPAPPPPPPPSCDARVPCALSRGQGSGPWGGRGSAFPNSALASASL